MDGSTRRFVERQNCTLTLEGQMQDLKNAPPGETRGDRKSPKPIATITSKELSWLAERADGSRDEDLALVRDVNGLPQIRESRDPGKPPVLEDGDELIANVRTSDSCKREKVVAVHIETQTGMQLPITGKGPDALFWTQSAVEKFLYPYYYSQRLWDDEMDKLKAKFSTDRKAF